ncbi:hypothetical protein [Streptomyces sp. YIM 98790]|uniref:hypothetical protein n=1 Tax=Streptomyces sp. YIM 98790 TaxID=2689077 RepID=UPI00140E2786|nr:hypothetical protein [Streptomyces sp. YIM 98790]
MTARQRARRAGLSLASAALIATVLPAFPARAGESGRPSAEPEPWAGATAWPGGPPPGWAMAGGTSGDGSGGAGASVELRHGDLCLNAEAVASGDTARAGVRLGCPPSEPPPAPAPEEPEPGPAPTSPAAPPPSSPSPTASPSPSPAPSSPSPSSGPAPAPRPASSSTPSPSSAPSPSASPSPSPSGPPEPAPTPTEAVSLTVPPRPAPGSDPPDTGPTLVGRMLMLLAPAVLAAAAMRPRGGAAGRGNGATPRSA